MDQIRPNIYLGDKHDARLLPILKSPVTAILNVAYEVPPENHKGIVCAHVEMRDSAEDARRRTKAALEVLDGLIQEGHVVLVHCKHGKSRSPHIVATYIALSENKDYDEAYEEVRSKRPKVLAYSIGREIREKFGQQVTWLSSVAQAFIRQIGKPAKMQNEEGEWDDNDLGLAMKEYMISDAYAKQAKVKEAWNKLRATMGQLPAEMTVDNTTSHPLMAKYDHSLEMNRWKGNSIDDGSIEMGDLTSEDV